MALTIYAGSGYQYGIATDETGINCSSFECRYYPEINAKLAGITGETIIRAISSLFSRDVKISGEVNGGGGIMAMALATAISVANDVNVFGNGAGDLLLDDVTESQAREGWRSVSASLSSNPLCSD